MVANNKAFDRWQKGLDTLATSFRDISFNAHVDFVDNNPSRRVQQIFVSETFQEFLSWYVEHRFRPILQRQFGGPDKNPSPFMPKIIEGQTAEGDLGFDRASNPSVPGDPRGVADRWAGGFRKLWGAVSKAEVSGGDFGAMVGIGPRADVYSDELNLRNYPVTHGKSTPSQFGSFFMAAEFGTGTFASVVRRSGKTKSDRGDGSWWFGRNNGRGFVGALFAGQQGLHFLYGRDGQTPNPVYEATLKETLLPSLAEYFKEKYPTVRIG